MNQGKLEVVKQEMARVNINILGIRKLGLEWVNLTQMTIISTIYLLYIHYIYYLFYSKNPLEEME